MTEFDPRLTPARSDLAALHLKGQVEASAFAPGVARQVCAAAAPVRRSPRADAGLDTELLCGEGFTVYEEKGGWAWGQAAFDHYVGYVPAAALTDEYEAPTHRVIALRSYVYPAPDLKTPPHALLSLNAKVTVKKRDAAFCSLSLGSGESYVFSGHLAPLEAPAPDFVAVAEMFLGTPYLWGGRQSLGLDCSALVQNALERAGVNAPRDTDMQARSLGEALPVSSVENALHRGDLVYWKGHVGIMVDASRLIHANATAMAVTIDPLGDVVAAIKEAEGPITAIRRLAFT